MQLMLTFFFFLQGVINEDWCFSLYTARNSVQVGKIIACINKKPSIVLFLNLVVAFISAHLDPFQEQCTEKAQAWMSTGVLLEGASLYLCVYT